MTHGFYRSSLYRVWKSMISRCENENGEHYANYGGRGIAVCDEWRHDFQTFYDYVSQLYRFGQEGMTIDRIDNDGNYEPGNVRWASQKEQLRNTTKNRMLTHNGETMCAADWADKLGISRGTFKSRLRYGWSVERIITEPIRGKTNAHQ